MRVGRARTSGSMVPSATRPSSMVAEGHLEEEAMSSTCGGPRRRAITEATVAFSGAGARAQTWLQAEAALTQGTNETS